MPSDLTTLDPDVLAQVVGALVVMTPEGEILSWDRGAEILFGFSPEEALHRSIFDLVIPADRAAETREQMQKALAIGAAVYESERLRKDGSALPVGVSMRPVKDAEGRTLIAKNDRDITHFAEDALRQSEARMKSVLDAALDAVVMMDEQGRITSWNACAEALFGWSHDEAVGGVLADLIIPPRYREAHARGLARFLETGEGPVIGRRIELSAVRRNRSEFPVELTVTALREKGAYFFSAFIADITERKQAEEALREAQQRLQHVVSSSPSVLYSLAVEGQTLTPRWVSANVERFTGYTPEEVQSSDWWAERLHPDDRGRVTAQVVPLLSQGSVVREYRFRHKDGAYRWIQDEQILVARPGEPDEVVGSWSDVTARKNAELKLHESE
ncbi:MAG TPA: PAS domain S-box protein, partial [Vicinamibacteria bacterium]|nr:PAS domain S-box protein [Vicinamibacteria bacterium]